jgi:uncharacterized membrane protein YfcA
MDATEILGLIAVGWCGGMLGGLVGVGGGVIFVPGLVIFLGLSQIEAESTSLVAIIFVATLGAWRQHGYGNLHPRDALLIGVLSPIGVFLGTGVANIVSERTLELGFAAVQLYFAWRLAKRAWRGSEPSGA